MLCVWPAPVPVVGADLRSRASLCASWRVLPNHGDRGLAKLALSERVTVHKPRRSQTGGVAVLLSTWKRTELCS
jgi:hypothetical protein